MVAACWLLCYGVYALEHLKIKKILTAGRQPTYNEDETVLAQDKANGGEA
jgi:hypothetical protein